MTRHGGWPNSGFGKRLFALRKKAKLSQEDLAALAGCSQPNIVRLERGKQEPAWPLVLLLAAALGVEVAAFIPKKRTRRT